MSPLKWLAFSIAMAIVFFVAFMDIRRHRRRRREVNARLENMACPACNASLAPWSGEKSSTFYTFVEGVLVQDVLSVTCPNCRTVYDVFLHTDGTLQFGPSCR